MRLCAPLSKSGCSSPMRCGEQFLVRIKLPTHSFSCNLLSKTPNVPDNVKRSTVTSFMISRPEVCSNTIWKVPVCSSFHVFQCDGQGTNSAALPRCLVPNPSFAKTGCPKKLTKRVHVCVLPDASSAVDT